jgi:hypothetical protein
MQVLVSEMNSLLVVRRVSKGREIVRGVGLCGLDILGISTIIEIGLVLVIVRHCFYFTDWDDAVKSEKIECKGEVGGVRKFS